MVFALVFLGFCFYFNDFVLPFEGKRCLVKWTLVLCVIL